MNKILSPYEQKWPHFYKLLTPGNIIVFFMPILGLGSISIIGELYISEIILLLLFPVLLILKYHLLYNRNTLIIIIMGILWLCGQILTDVIRDTSSQDFLRGWAKIIFFIVSFMALTMLIDSEFRIMLWIAATVIPSFFRPFKLFADDPNLIVIWKFGVGAAVLLFFAIPCLYKIFKLGYQKKYISYLISLHFIIGIISFFYNARSLAGLCIFSGFILIFYKLFNGKKVTLSQVLIGLSAGFMLINFIIGIYSWGASNGTFGLEAYEKYQAQVQYGGSAYSILLGGRSESLVSTEAISDSFWLGHGSWAKNFYYANLYLELRQQFSGQSTGEMKLSDLSDGLIPTHSYLLGAWVEAGILGGLFWITVVAVLLISIIPASWQRKDFISVFFIFSLTGFLWNVLFSPFGANVKVEVAGFLAIACYINHALRQPSKNATT
jgi:hypothetical protein